MGNGLGLGAIALIGIGALFLFDIAGFRTKLTAIGFNPLNPPAISSTTRILGFDEGSITGTEITKQVVSPPQRTIFQSTFNIGDFARQLDLDNLKRAISEFGFIPKS